MFNLITRKTIASAVMTSITFTAMSLSAFGQQIPEGTRLRVKLNEPLVSGQAAKGHIVEFVVAEGFSTPEGVAIAEGARATGQITLSESKGRMGKGGKLDFTIDRVIAADGASIPLRHTPHPSQGNGSKKAMVAMMAGIAVFVPVAAPIALLKKGKDIRLERGTAFDVYTDRNHELAGAKTKAPGVSETPSPAPVAALKAAPGQPSDAAQVSVQSTETSAEITINGKYMGNAPLRVTLKPGTYQFKAVAGSKVWERSLAIEGGSDITLNADPAAPATLVTEVR